MPAEDLNNVASGVSRVEVVFTAGNTPITGVQLPNSPGLVVVDGQTMSPSGSAETLVHGEVISENANGLVVIDGSLTQTVSFSTVERVTDAAGIVSDGPDASIQVPGTKSATEATTATGPMEGDFSTGSLGPPVAESGASNLPRKMFALCSIAVVTSLGITFTW